MSLRELSLLQDFNVFLIERIGSRVTRKFMINHVANIPVYKFYALMTSNVNVQSMSVTIKSKGNSSTLAFSFYTMLASFFFSLLVNYCWLTHSLWADTNINLIWFCHLEINILWPIIHRKEKIFSRIKSHWLLFLVSKQQDCVTPNSTAKKPPSPHLTSSHFQGHIHILQSNFQGYIIKGYGYTSMLFLPFVKRNKITVLTNTGALHFMKEGLFRALVY